MQFDWTHFVIPGSCLAGGSKSRLLLSGLVPLFLMAVSVVLGCLPFVFSYCRSRICKPAVRSAAVVGRPFCRGLKAAALRCLPIVLLFSFCLCTSVSSGAFSAWDCVEFILDSRTDAKTSFLRKDLSIECGTELHAQVQQIATIWILVWPVGMPLLYFFLLWTCRAALIKRESTPFTRAISFLHQEYRRAFYWWEVATCDRTRDMSARAAADVRCSILRSSSRSS